MWKWLSQCAVATTPSVRPDDPVDKMVENALDREVGEEGSRELAEHGCKGVFVRRQGRSKHRGMCAAWS